MHIVTMRGYPLAVKNIQTAISLRHLEGNAQSWWIMKEIRVIDKLARSRIDGLNNLGQTFIQCRLRSKIEFSHTLLDQYCHFKMNCSIINQVVDNKPYFMNLKEGFVFFPPQTKFRSN